jgi:hypothetical protein
MVSMEEYSVGEILKHVHEDKKMVFENVGLNGELLEGYDGRHLVNFFFCPSSTFKCVHDDIHVS